jgi:mRNA interferase MazF
MREGSVILTVIFQVDGRRKNRPALILREMPRYGDLLICGISTQLKQYTPNFDEIVRMEDPDFITSGLVKESLIRLTFLAAIQRTEVIGSIGSIDNSRHSRLLSNLANYLSITTLPSKISDSE